MTGEPEFLRTLALVLGAAAVATIVFQWLKQPVVLGYLLAGAVVGPHVPIPLFVDEPTVRLLSELGVILLMFALGLEFSLRKLFKVGKAAGLIALIQCSLMIWLGYTAGRAFGWSGRESLYAGAIVAISSTTIIVKAFEERGTMGNVRELVYGILIVEDLIAILLLTVLTTISGGKEPSVGEILVTAGRLVAFLVGLLVVGMLLVPRLIRAVARLNRPETTTVTSIAICFASAFLAHTFGYSVALGAFIAGSLIAESGEEKTIEKLVHPIRDVFAAIFFVSVGMLIDPVLVARHWVVVVVFTVVVVVGKVVSVSLGAFLAGCGARTSLQAGMSLAQIGEFSFIIASLGMSTGAIGEALYPVAVAVSAVTTLLTPWFIRASGGFAAFVDARLPRPLQTFVTLYGSWVDALHAAPQGERALRQSRRLARFLVLDACVFAAIVIGAALLRREPPVALADYVGISESATRLLVLGAAALLALPFVVGMFRCARQLGVMMAVQAFPKRDGTLDMAAAPRRAFVVTLELAIALGVGIPLIAVTQPFLSTFEGATILAVVLALLGIAFWRSTRDLEGHVRAGTQVVVEALGRQGRGNAPDPRSDDFDALAAALPGLGSPRPFRLAPGSYGVGKTLMRLNLRGATGATVLAIRRANGDMLTPSAADVLAEGDLLALAGACDAIEAAGELLANGSEGRDRQLG